MRAPSMIMDGRDVVVVVVRCDDVWCTEFPCTRVPGCHTHGTGCTFAAALAAHLAQGRSVRQAIPLAQACITGAMRQASAAATVPMQHFWGYRDEEDTGGH